MSNTANHCNLCGTGCVGCSGGKCRGCGFDPLKVYRANQVVAIAREYITDEEDKGIVRRMIFENKSPEEIKEYLSNFRATEKDERVKEQNKRRLEQELERKKITKIQAIERAEHKFDGIGDSAMCEYCHGTRFYHKNTPCKAFQKILQETL